MNEAIEAGLNALDVRVEALPKYDTSDSPKWAERMNSWTVTLRKGNARVDFDYYTGKTVEGVTRADVVDGLLADWATLESVKDFEDWAIEFGYNPDSITDKKTYDLCVSNAHKLTTLFDEGELKLLNVLFEEY